MIFLNAEAYLEEAIASVFTQTHAHWELLLVDDGSNDRSSAIAREMANRNPGRVRYLEHPDHQNRGMSASRNLGIAHASGEYVAFLDSDDVWLPRRLERHLNVLLAAPDVAMVYGPTLYWHSWTNDLSGRKRDFVRSLYVRPESRIEPPELLRIFLRTGGAALPGICSLLIRREALLEIGGFDEAFRGAFEDQVFLSKAALSMPIIAIEEYLDKYRQHPDSYSAAAMAASEYDAKRPNPARLRFLQWLETYLQDQAVDDALLWRWLKREFRPYRQQGLHTILTLPRRAAAPVLQVVRRTLRAIVS